MRDDGRQVDPILRDSYWLFFCRAVFQGQHCGQQFPVVGCRPLGRGLLLGAFESKCIVESVTIPISVFQRCVGAVVLIKYKFI